MIDTIKLQVPLTERQWLKLFDLLSQNDKPRWTLFNLKRGEYDIVRMDGLIESDRASHRRELMWDIPGRYDLRGTYLTIEFSIPKYWYGHNVHLLYDWVTALRDVRKLLHKHLDLRGMWLPPIEEWKLRRVDFCYAWRLPGDTYVKSFIDALKRLKYPWKSPNHRPGSAFWPGKTYSVKIYDKHREFRANDLKKLIKKKASLDWINQIEEKSVGVIRFEITGRSKWLKRIGLNTVGDLMGDASVLRVTPELLAWAKDLGGADYMDVIHRVMVIAGQAGHLPTTEDGDVYIDNNVTVEIPEMTSPPLDSSGSTLTIPAGMIQFKAVNRAEFILTKYLEKLVGDGSMSMEDQIKQKLEAVYKSSKVGRLMGVWLLVKSVGAEEAKELLGKTIYYRAVKELKDAGVPLLDKSKPLVTLQADFFNAFKMTVPSPYVTNEWDDFKDGDNLLNIANWKRRSDSERAG